MKLAEQVRRQLRWCCATTTALVLLGGCTGASPDAKPTPKAKGKVTTPAPSEAESAEALTTYRAMWHDLTMASHTSNPESSELGDHATGGALELMKYGLRKARRGKIVSKGEPLPSPKVIRATDQEVELRDCVDGRNWLEYKLNGELKNSVPGSHFRADATVRHQRGIWKVSYLYMHGSGSC
ncbi:MULTISPECIES: hypothetical protein [unclassified Streptomyces]|uniref:hypothetical protein n=1 Tax=unclassified Streptomyces TaxID=2593676 RepID=UPI00344EA0AE